MTDSADLQNPRTRDLDVVVGVTGGIASYKTAALVSKLAQSGMQTQVVMTPAAERFIGAATFAALSGRAVATSLFDPTFPLGAHIELARRAKILCIAPATANFLARMATGQGDDLLSTLYLCFQGTTIVAPAMNCEMWDHPAVARNVEQVRKDGVTIVEPEEGWLSCRVQGKGRMAEPEQMLSTILAAVADAR